eukprot:356042-Chlamydomonas_euryale.AAC.1
MGLQAFWLNRAMRLSRHRLLLSSLCLFAWWGAPGGLISKPRNVAVETSRSREFTCPAAQRAHGWWPKGHGAPSQQTPGSAHRLHHDAGRMPMQHSPRVCHTTPPPTQHTRPMAPRRGLV